MTEFRQHYLPSEYDTKIECMIGRLVLLYGQIDRLLIRAIKEKSNPKIDIASAIAVVREHNKGRGMMLGAWIAWLTDSAKDYGIAKEWTDEVIAHINAMRPIRDQIIHDTLMLNENYRLEWKTNQSKSSDRDHKDFEMAELVSALDTFYKFRAFIAPPVDQSDKGAIAKRFESV